MRAVGKPLKVRVIWKARAKPGYAAYKLARSHRVR